MKPNQFYAGRVPVAASEPNLSGLGALAALPSMAVVHVAGLLGALCLGLMLGLLFGSGAHWVSMLLIGLGGALMFTACIATNWK